MKKTFKISGKEVEFEQVTAVFEMEAEAGRRPAILIHDAEDEFHDGDGVIFETDIPESAEEAEDMLMSAQLITNCETLDTVERING